jgi:hypothetical protein
MKKQRETIFEWVLSGKQINSFLKFDNIFGNLLSFYRPHLIMWVNQDKFHSLMYMCCDQNLKYCQLLGLKGHLRGS